MLTLIFQLAEIEAANLERADVPTNGARVRARWFAAEGDLVTAGEKKILRVQCRLAATPRGGTAAIMDEELLQLP
jgi:hypothetical protein